MCGVCLKSVVFPRNRAVHAYTIAFFKPQVLCTFWVSNGNNRRYAKFARLFFCFALAGARNVSVDIVVCDFLSTSRQNIDRPRADLYCKMACFRGPRLRTALRSPKPGGPLSRDCRGTVVCPIFGTAGRSSNGDRGTRVLPCFSRCVCTGCLPFFVCLLSGCLFVCLLFVCLLFVCLLVGWLVGWLVFGWWVGVVGVWQSSSCLVIR